MSDPIELAVDGVGFWAPSLPGWGVARAAFASGSPGANEPAPRPAPARLAPNERRRAPDAVAVALAVADEAVQASGHDPATLPSVFTSAHGDLATVDALCRTLAEDPRHLSPTRFHHSVHNAPSGYWAIAVGAAVASTALSAHRASFAAGLLEAATQVRADATPVLLVGVDTEARGPLASVHDSRGLLGCALVLAPAPGPATMARLSLSLRAGASRPPAPAGAAARPWAGHPLADALPLAEALAHAAAGPGPGKRIDLDLPLHGDLSLVIRVDPWTGASSLP